MIQTTQSNQDGKLTLHQRTMSQLQANIPTDSPYLPTCLSMRIFGKEYVFMNEAMRWIATKQHERIQSHEH